MICAVPASLVGAGSVTAQDVVVDRGLNVKGAFIFYLSRFVAWPVERNDDPPVPYIFCVIDEPVFRRHLDEDLRGRTIRGLQVVVKGYNSEEIAGSIKPACDLAYFENDRPASQSVLEAMSDQPVLTIGMTERFLEKGGIIRIYPRANKMHFALNLTAARRARLQFTAQILELAEAIVRTDRASSPGASASPQR